jgi:hypothetical protein
LSFSLVRTVGAERFLHDTILVPSLCRTVTVKGYLHGQISRNLIFDYRKSVRQKGSHERIWRASIYKSVILKKIQISNYPGKTELNSIS